ncbi:MAG: cystathionine beta-synthase [Winogradskyella sp.]|uniref:Cystathionine beta-synthase n=1 Tax=Winogradskyella poriferorum TaxID=307627 RepID=A0ABU7W9K2_9FLAO|nr:cystathionine beta-synthase [Winogradskyella sp.]|tara:strand:- start:16944 stop:18788 length:1845 start_codon:yes stop_codon:yes gene_type:complete
MKDFQMLNYIKNTIENMPSDWLNLTTHRLDIYNEKLAKTQFIAQFENLYKSEDSSTESLNQLPTAYDYIRLGHPLSSVLEWTIAKLNGLNAENVISFSSESIPVLAVLRTNLLEQRATRIVYTNNLPKRLNVELLKSVYNYNFEILQVEDIKNIEAFDGSTILISKHQTVTANLQNDAIDFYVNLFEDLGSVLLISDKAKTSFISDIQHVRRRETIAMTPSNCLVALKAYTNETTFSPQQLNTATHKAKVKSIINEINATSGEALVASSGLSIQYAIMMGLIDNAQKEHTGKAIKFVVPPNCYGGTNDQARRVAACLDNVEIVDLPVDGDNDMVNSVEKVLTQLAKEDAIPYIIAEIPTNPRVEVPDLEQLNAALSKVRQTPNGTTAIAPVFILDQTFCPNVQFLGDDGILSNIKTIAYVSGSKFPSGGKCTAGYAVANAKAEYLIQPIARHLELCDNEATALQYQILATQMPSMLTRIADAYKNTRAFVNYIHEVLPDAKINFVSEELAAEGFTPSVFSLDLPTKGNTDEERETYKRALNLRLINLMITEVPTESKYCVSYGQLKGCYWTIPATSTQGTTKEGDKDYIARVAVSPDLDLEKHKAVFLDFVESL